jgi:hypothetical protein
MKLNQTKKMSLNKTTVANLGNVELNDVKGGTNTGITCVFCDTNASCIDDTHCMWQFTCPVTCSQ